MANGLEQEQYKSKYTGSEIDGLLDFVNNNQNNLATLQDIPAVPSKTSDLTNDNEFITNTVNNLLNYYLKTEVYSKTEAYAKTEVYAKTETYTKAEIGALISASASGGFIKVNELPTENINDKAIYLVPYTGSKTGNLYEEYIYVDNAWEMIGTTKLDLSNYVTTTDLSTALGDYVTSTALNTALADYLTSASFNTQIANYYNKTEITGLLAGKVDNDKIGAANGVASLGNDGKVPSSQLPEQQNSGVSDFDDLTNRPQKEVTSIESIIDPVPLPTHNQVGSVGFTPIGTIISVIGTTAPRHYLACDGQIVNISDYQELADYFEEQFGSINHFGGNGIDTFAVPDLRGEFLRGTGTNSHENQGSGANVGEHQDGTEVPNITYYSATATNSNIAIRIGKNVSVLPNNMDKELGSSSGQAWIVTNQNNTVSNCYSYTSRPTNTSVLYCIAIKNIYVDARFDYSTQETVIGTWIDGKTIYQKTVEITNLPNNEMLQIPHNISNIGVVVNCFGMLSTSGNYGYTPIPRVQDNTTTYNLAIDILETSIQLKARTFNSTATFNKAYVTILYTKTTD